MNATGNGLPPGLRPVVLTTGLLLAIILSHSPEASAQAADLYPQGTRNVLILQSYHKQFSWTDSIVEGIDKVLGQSRHRIIAYSEYMDTKRFPGPDRTRELREHYMRKYRDIPIDVIICADDNAYHLLLESRSELFPGTPVVFCGVNDFNPDDLPAQGDMTGVAEIIDAKPTIDLALRLHPKVKTIHVLVDRTETGAATRKDLQKVMPGYAGRVGFTFLDDLTMEENLAQVGRLGPDSLILLLNYNLDGKGRFFDHRETIALLSAASPVPIYGCWDFQLGSGIVGGKLIMGRLQGEAAARQALRILDGERPADVPVVTGGTDRFLFDYNQLKRFSIPTDALPKGSEVINSPPSFYEINKKIIWGFGAILGLLLLLLGGLALHIVQRREGERAQRRMNRSLVILSTCNQRLIVARDESELLEDICRVVVESGGYLQCRVGFASAGSERIRIMGRWTRNVGRHGVSEPHVPIEPDDTERSVLFTGRALVLRLPAGAPEPGPPVRSSIALPLRSQGGVFGILRIESLLPDAFDTEEMHLLTTLADNLAYGIMALRHAADRRAVLNELRQSKEQLSFLLESLPIVPFTAGSIDLGDVTYVGAAVTDMTGHPATAFQDDPSFWRARVHADDLPGALSAFKSLRPGGTVQHRYRFRKADDSYLWLSDTRRVDGSQDGAAGSVTGVWQDVTEDQILREEAEYRRRQVIQADKLASLGEVVAGVAHEINNPNAFISYNIPLLEETWGVFRPMVQEYSERTPQWRRNGLSLAEYCQDMDEIITDISAGALRISGVVQNLKEFSRFSDSSEPSRFSLNDAVNKAMLIVGAQVRKVFRTVSLELEPGLEELRGRPLEIEQVVANLLVNATQAVPGEGGVLVVRTAHLKELGALLLEVQDNGRGMSRGVLQHVFEPFFTTRRDSGGTGLGLSVSYRLVREHDGFFCVLSRPGRGTRFSVLLPTAGVPIPLPRPTVCCVEPGNALSLPLSPELAEASWAVASVRSAGELDAAFAAHPEYAVALVDARCLDEEALLAWRARHPLPLLVLTGDARPWPGADRVVSSLQELFPMDELLGRIVQVIL